MSNKGFNSYLKDLVLNPRDYSENPDHPACPECSSLMNFYGHDDDGDFALGDGYWECPDCGYQISESDIF